METVNYLALGNKTKIVSGRDGGGRAKPDGRRVRGGGRTVDLLIYNYHYHYYYHYHFHHYHTENNQQVDLPARELPVRPGWPRSPWPAPRRPLDGSDGSHRAKLLEHARDGQEDPATSKLVTPGRNGTETKSAVVMHDGTASAH